MTDLEGWRAFLARYGLAITLDPNAYGADNEYDERGALVRRNTEGHVLGGEKLDQHYANATLWFDAAGHFLRLEVRE